MNENAPRTLYDLVESNERKLDRLGSAIQDAQVRALRVEVVKRKLKLAVGALATTREMLDASQELLSRLVDGDDIDVYAPYIKRLAGHYNSLKQVADSLDLSVDD
jgi:hypothetical protein